MNIAIQGKKGSYSHIAAHAYFGEEATVVEHEWFDSVFEDLDSGKVDYVVVPFENSTYGSVYQSYDLVTKYDSYVVGEMYVKINFHIIANPGVKLSDITEIYTHPVAMGQIKTFLADHKNIHAIEYPDTAGAVEMIKESKLDNAAAAASKFAAEMYGMEILKENIHENSRNYTRFFVLSRNENNKEEDAQKTTIQFELGEEAGSLYKSLRAFADRDIALTKIESRPIIETHWEYRFYVDAEAGLHEEKFQSALKELKAYVTDLRILGTYRKGEYINS